MSDDEQKAIYKDYADFNKTPGMQAGLPLGLPNSAKTVKVRNGKVEVKEGLYLSEGIGGYCVFEAENLETAIKLAARIPAARLGGAIEIRCVEKYW
jgi:hypothetical protein